MSNAEKVAAVYGAFGRGDVPAILELLSDDVEWEPEAMDNKVPWIVPGRGKENVMRFFGALAEIDITTFDVRNILTGGSQVAAVILVEATHKRTGKTVRDLEMHLWGFDDAGNIVSFKHLIDTHQQFLMTQP